MNFLSKNSSIFAISAITIISLTRFLPHPPNFTALGAMAIFGGAIFSSNILRYAVPLLALFFTDVILNNFVYQISNDFVLFYEGFAFTYLGIALIVLLSATFLKKLKAVHIFGTSIVASFVFFVVSNFGVWMSGMLYPKTIEGLIGCYVAGLPYLLNGLAGDLFYSGVLFGAYYLASEKLQLQKSFVSER